MALVESVPINGPKGKRVTVLFYDDDSVKIRVHESGPMVITQAFLTGQGKHVIIRLKPMG